MCEERVWTELIDYIVANYDEEMAEELVDLVADALPDLQEWLGHLIAKYGESSGLLKKFGIGRK
jgi:hypothetical protein